MKIEIFWLMDSHFCEACGESYATGAHVKFDGKTAIELIPRAGCVGGDDYTDEDVYRAIFSALGHELDTKLEGIV